MKALLRSIVTWVSLAARSGPSSSKNAFSVSALFPSPTQTTRLRTWSTTTVTYSWFRRKDSSSTPMTVRSSSRSGPRRAETMRSMIEPVDADQFADGGPVHLLGEVGDQLLQVLGESREGCGPGNELDANAARLAIHTPRGVAEPEHPSSQRQVAPAPGRAPVIGRPDACALAAPRFPPSRSDVHHDSLLLEAHRADDQPDDTDELPKYRRDPHGLPVPGLVLGSSNLREVPCVFSSPCSLLTGPAQPEPVDSAAATKAGQGWPKATAVGGSALTRRRSRGRRARFILEIDPHQLQESLQFSLGFAQYAFGSWHGRLELTSAAHP